MIKRQLKRSDFAIALALFVVVVVLGFLRMSPGVCGTYHDDGIYAITAKSLSEGTGYRLIDLPGSPFQTKYPILYPAVLSLFWSALPTLSARIIGMQFFSLVCGAVNVALLYLFFIRFRYFHRMVALAGSLLGATSCMYLYLSSTVLSESLFALTVTTALWCAESLVSPTSNRESDSDWRDSIWKFFAVGILVGIPVLVRQIGITVVPAVCWFLRRSKARGLLVVAGAALVILPWIWWSSQPSQFPLTHEVAAYYRGYASEWITNLKSNLGSSLGANSIAVLMHVALVFSEGFNYFSKMLLHSAAVFVLLVIGIMTLASILVQAVKGKRLLPLVLVFYILLLLLWLSSSRFMAPYAVPLATYFVSSLVRIFRRLRMGNIRRIAPAAVVCMLVCFNIAGVLELHQRTVLSGGYPPIQLGDEQSSWLAYGRLNGWLRVHASSADVIASGMDPIFYLYAGFKGYRPYFGHLGNYLHEAIPTANDFLDTLARNHTRFLIDVPQPERVDEQAYAQIFRSLQGNPRLRVSYKDEDPRFVIYELIAASSAPPNGVHK